MSEPSASRRPAVRSSARSSRRTVGAAAHARHDQRRSAPRARLVDVGAAVDQLVEVDGRPGRPQAPSRTCSRRSRKSRLAPAAISRSCGFSWLRRQYSRLIFSWLMRAYATSSSSRLWILTATKTLAGRTRATLPEKPAVGAAVEQQPRDVDGHARHRTHPGPAVVRVSAWSKVDFARSAGRASVRVRRVQARHKQRHRRGFWASASAFC